MSNVKEYGIHYISPAISHEFTEKIDKVQHNVNSNDSLKLWHFHCDL